MTARMSQNLVNLVNLLKLPCNFNLLKDSPVPIV